MKTLSHLLFQTATALALAGLAAGCSGAAAEDDDAAASGALAGVQDPSVAVPGTDDVKSCGDASDSAPRLRPETITAFIRANPKLSQVLDQTTGYTLVNLTGNAPDKRKLVKTWKPSPNVFGDWAPSGALLAGWTGTFMEQCLSCPYGRRDVVKTITEPLDMVDVYIGYDAAKEKVLSVSLLRAGPSGAASLVAGPPISVGGETRPSVKAQGEGIFTLNCSVDAVGKVSCPESIVTSVPEGPSGPRSFHDLKFSGKFTEKCLLLTSKNVKDGAVPSEGVYGVAVGARFDLGGT